MQTHPISGVLMDIAAFKVSLCVVLDRNTTALRAARARSSNIGALVERCRQGQKVTTHPRDSLIRVDVGVGQRCCHTRADIESPTLLAKRTSALRSMTRRGDE